MDNVTTPIKKNYYGTGSDLSYAQNKLGVNNGNFIDTGVQGYQAPTTGYTNNDYVLGGTGTVGGVADGGSANRLWGMDSQATKNAIDYYASNGKAMNNAYGTGVDLENAKARLGGGYNYVDLANYKPGTFNGVDGDLVFGGTGVTSAVNQGNAKRLAGADRYATNDAINGYGNKVDARKDAEDVYNPQYNSSVTAIKNALASKLLAMEQSKTGVNTRYDNQIKDVNRNNELNQHSFANNLDSRGMGRSTFYTSGVAGLNDSANRVTNNVNTNRNGELSGIDANKVLEQGNTDNTLLTMQGDRDTKINALARENERYAGDIDFRNKGFDYGKTQDAIKNDQWNKTFDYSKAQDAAQLAIAQQNANTSASRSSGSGSSASAKKESATQDLNDFTAELMRQGDGGNGQAFLKANRDAVISRYGSEAYAKLQKVANSGYTYPTTTSNEGSDADMWATLRNN